MSARRVGPYEVQEQLGRGGMGTVYRARDTRSGQVVALKLVAGAADDTTRRRLAHEAQALRLLRHPSVVTILEAGEEQGQPWLALELVRGRSLQERLDREGPLAPRQAAELVAAVADALGEAHARGVLHRDLKPDNVLLPEDGGPPKLLDFGLAGFLIDLGLTQLTQTGTLQGTPGYWAPEQCTGDRTGIGPRTDVYGLGALLYACLTGRAPFQGTSLIELLAATTRGTPDAPGADPALDALALTCLRRWPEERPASAIAVRDELVRWLGADRQARRGRRRRRPWAGRVAAAAALVGAGAVVTWLAARSSAPTASPSDPPPAPTSDPPPAPTPPVGAAPDPRAELEAALARADPRAELEAALASARSRTLVGDPGALADCDRALAIDPRLAAAHAWRGLWQQEAEAWAAARVEVDRALALDPEQAVALAVRGLLRAAPSDPGEGLADCDRAIELAPREGICHAERGRARLAIGDVGGARRDLDRALELEPRLASAYRERGAMRAGQGDHAGAVADLDRAIELQPAKTIAWVNRGVAKASLGQPEAALLDLDHAVELEPTAAVCFGTRGAVRAARKDRRALADHDQAVALDPRRAQSFYERSLARKMFDDPDGAHEDLVRAAALAPRNAGYRVQLALSLEARGELAAAAAAFEEAVQLAPRAEWAREAQDRAQAIRARLGR